jgi:hypothetical protein
VQSNRKYDQFGQEGKKRDAEQTESSDVQKKPEASCNVLYIEVDQSFCPDNKGLSYR